MTWAGAVRYLFYTYASNSQIHRLKGNKNIFYSMFTKQTSATYEMPRPPAPVIVILFFIII